MTAPLVAVELAHLATYDFTGRSEADVRGDWIDPLLRLLGYGLGTRHDVKREVQLRLEPPVRALGSTRLTIDYSPTVFGRHLWIIEAKRPQTDLFSDENLGQAWSYATDPRINVPLMLICDGTRLGVFEVGVEGWSTPVLDIPKADIPDRFDEVVEWLGAARVAERIRLRQLEHLRTALEAQVDLGALDRTLEEVKHIVTQARPIVEDRRRQIRAEVRARAEEEAQRAIDSIGVWSFIQHINTPIGPSRYQVAHTAELVQSVDPGLRVREFDQIVKATTPAGESDSRMWFSIRALRLATAVLLSDTDGCADHCQAVARRATTQHSTGFAGEPILQETYRLQKALGRYVWRVAPTAHASLDERAKEWAQRLDAEEWLRLDSQWGITADDDYERITRLMPRWLLNRISPWSIEKIESAGNEVEAALARTPKTAGFERMQPAGDPWLDSWEIGDPLRDISVALLQYVGEAPQSSRVRALAAELLTSFA